MSRSVATVPRRGLIVLTSAVALTAIACDTGDGRDLRPAGPDQTASVFNSTTTTIPADPAVLGSGLPGEGVGELGLTLRAPWDDEAVIDVRFTCDSAGGESGEGLSPALSWSGIPVEATNLAVVVTDLSADGFVHWVVAGIDPGVTGLGEGEAPAGGIQGTNGFGEVGWGGPCPPPGTGEHEYLVQLHALDQDLGLAPGFDGDDGHPGDRGVVDRHRQRRRALQRRTARCRGVEQHHGPAGHQHDRDRHSQHGGGDDHDRRLTGRLTVG